MRVAVNPHGRHRAIRGVVDPADTPVSGRLEDIDGIVRCSPLLYRERQAEGLIELIYFGNETGVHDVAKSSWFAMATFSHRFSPM